MFGTAPLAMPSSIIGGFEPEPAPATGAEGPCSFFPWGWRCVFDRLDTEALVCTSVCTSPAGAGDVADWPLLPRLDSDCRAA